MTLLSTANKNTKYGLDFEPLAIKTFEKETNLKVNDCGWTICRTW